VGPGEESPDGGAGPGEESPGGGIGLGDESAGNEHPGSGPAPQPPVQESASTNQVSKQRSRIENLSSVPCEQPASNESQGLPVALPGTGARIIPCPNLNGTAADPLPEGEAPGRRSKRARKITQRAIEAGLEAG
jgi:hypothetical protein